MIFEVTLKTISVEASSASLLQTLSNEDGDTDGKEQ